MKIKMKNPYHYGRFIVSRLLVRIILSGIIMLMTTGISFAQNPTNSATLIWTAPGDDNDQGTASIYDLRYSTSTITDNSWDSAIQVSNEPTPQPAGSQETFTINQLEPGTTYYFAIKSADEVPNWSDLSNIYIYTTANEQNQPSAIADLVTSNPTDSSISLTWTAPGDDSTSGTASAYDVRYSTSIITVDNWDSSTQVNGEPSPQVAGSQETFTVTGLESNTTYYFAVKTADEVPNWSDLSNVASGITPDVTPPAAIDDLRASTGENEGELNLYWTAPGDDSLSGTATAYMIKISTDMITESSWDSATAISDLPVPLEPGSEQSIVITGLIPAQRYFAAMKTVDESSNLSDISNVDSAAAMFNFGSDIDDKLALLPDEFDLAQNYPNPFNPSTQINFSLPVESFVKLEIYSITGQKAITLVDGLLPAGFHTSHWQGRNSNDQQVSSGIYLYILHAGDYVETKKMAFLK